MDGKKVKEIIQKVVNDIRNKENECYMQMAYMNEHKFNMEREAIRYRQEAYNASWLMVADALDEISKLLPYTEEEETGPPSIFNKDDVLKALNDCNQDRKKAAAVFGVSDRTLYRRMKQLGIT